MKKLIYIQDKKLLLLVNLLVYQLEIRKSKKFLISKLHPKFGEVFEK